jgi:molybdopterin-guanine dinucleotide biosynthesis protein A
VTAVAILAGGASRRFGAPKALAECDGVPLAARIAASARAAGATEVVLVGGQPDVLAPLGLDVVADLAPGEGPVGGVLTALERLGGAHELVVVAACDLAALDASTIALVVTGLRAAGPSTPAAVAATLRREPALTVWRAAAAGDVRRAFERGVRAMHELLTGLGAVEVPVRPAALVNVNTPHDLAVACRAMPIHEVDADQLAANLISGAHLVDVRQPDEYLGGHVPGARLVPLATVPDRLDAFLADGTTYVICHSGGRSMRACEFLAAQGFDVVNVAGGTSSWVRSGRDVAVGDLPS